MASLFESTNNLSGLKVMLRTLLEALNKAYEI